MMRSGPGRRRPTGFTLIEILIVITIIGLLASFVLIVSMEGIERARERATQSLIAKLDGAVQERLNQLLSTQAPVNLTHKYLAWPVDSLNMPASVYGVGYLPGDSQRAEAIARIDYLKAQMPDVFFVREIPNNTTANTYPFNFAAAEYPFANVPVAGAVVPHFPYVLPLGNAVGMSISTPESTSIGAVPYNPADGPPSPLTLPGYSPAGTGIYGASYTAAAGILKNLGNVPKDKTGVDPTPYLPTGYDGIDNDGDGLVDEWNEGVNGGNLAAVQASLGAHTHNTARSEALYAFLIESPGSLIGADSFKESEIADTDGDGLPEFVDGWDQPLQFFRWPSHYHSDLQRGVNPEAFAGPEYPNAGERRESNPFDPNNQLVSPIWWADPSSMPDPGRQSFRFQNLFFSLCNPYPVPPSLPGSAWDRTGYFKRRQFAMRFLILSGGADTLPGVPLLPNGTVISGRAGGESVVATHLVLSENIAAPYALNVGPTGTTRFERLRVTPRTDAAAVLENQELFAAGQDDVTNHNLRVTGGTSK